MEQRKLTIILKDDVCLDLKNIVDYDFVVDDNRSDIKFVNNIIAMLDEKEKGFE